MHDVRHPGEVIEPCHECVGGTLKWLLEVCPLGEAMVSQAIPPCPDVGAWKLP